MASWNYRVIRKVDKETDTVTYQVHEVYYADNGTIEGWAKNAVKPIGENLFELREDIRYSLRPSDFLFWKKKQLMAKPNCMLMMTILKLIQAIILNLWIGRLLPLIMFINFWEVTL